MTTGLPLSPVPVAGPRSRAVVRWVARLPFVLACLVALVMAASLGSYYYPDTTAYVEHTFFTNLQRGFNDRSPVFPLLLDLVMRVAPPAARMCVLVVLQQIGYVAVVVLLARCGQRFGRPWAGWIAAMLAVVSLPMWLYGQGAQTESLYVFLAILGSSWFLRGAAGGRARDVVLAGVAAGLALGCRSVGVALVAAVLAAIWLARAPRKLRLTAAFLPGVAAAVAALVGVNWIRFGFPSLVNGGGVHVFDRIALLDRALPDTKECRALQRLNATKGRRKDTVFYRYAGWDLFWLMRNQGMSPLGADRFLTKVSIQQLTADPLRWLRLTVVSMEESLRETDRVIYYLSSGSVDRAGYEETDRNSVLNWTGGQQPDYYRSVEANLPAYPPPMLLGTWPAAVVRGWDDWLPLWRGSWVLYALAGACLYGLVRRDVPIVLFSFTALGQLAVAALAEEPMGRYWDPSIPMFHAALAFCAADLALVARGAITRRGADRFRRARTVPAGAPRPDAAPPPGPPAD